MGIFSFNSKRVNKKDHLGKRQSLMWSITLAGYRRQVGDLVQNQERRGSASNNLSAGAALQGREYKKKKLVCRNNRIRKLIHSNIEQSDKNQQNRAYVPIKSQKVDATLTVMYYNYSSVNLTIPGERIWK